MKKPIIIFLIGFILVAVIIYILYSSTPSSCSALEKQIKETLEEVNHCTTVEDCVVEMRYGCPFGCYQFYNKNSDLSSIDKLVEDYQNTECNRCVYSCLQAPQGDEMQCINGKCTDTRIY